MSMNDELRKAFWRVGQALDDELLSGVFVTGKGKTVYGKPEFTNGQREVTINGKRFLIIEDEHGAFFQPVNDTPAKAAE